MSSLFEKTYYTCLVKMDLKFEFSIGCFEWKWGFTGGLLLSSFTLGSKLACYRMCQHHSECVYLSYINKEKNCQLYGQGPEDIGKNRSMIHRH